MTAHPKQKCTKANRGMRRSHDAITMPGLAECSKCGELKRPHHICGNCGTYKNKQVLAKSNS